MPDQNSTAIEATPEAIEAAAKAMFKHLGGFGFTDDLSAVRATIYPEGFRTLAMIALGAAGVTGIATRLGRPLTSAPEAHKTAGVLAPTDDEFRAIGMTGMAREFPRSERQLAMFAAFLNVRVDQIPAPARYFANASMRDAWQRVEAVSTPSVPAVAELSGGGLARVSALAAERDFAHGYLIAVANLINLHDEPTAAADLLGEAGYTMADVDALGLSDYDLSAFRKLRNEPHARDFFAKRKSKFALTASPAGDDPKALDAAARSSSTEAVEQERPTGHFAIDHDGFAGTVIGHYTTLEGKQGVVLQQDGTRVVHVYGEKWLKPADAVIGSLPGAAVEQKVERREIEADSACLRGFIATYGMTPTMAVAGATNDERRRCAGIAERWLSSPEGGEVYIARQIVDAILARPSPVPAACKPEGETHG